MSEKLTIDPNAMTIGDLEDFEDVVGLSMDKAFKPVPVLDDEGNRVYAEPDDKGIARPEMTVELSTKALKALVWIIKRQDDPNFTLEDARNVKVSELDIEGEPDSADHPTVASA